MSRCSGCGVPVAWNRTERGKRIPLNPGARWVKPCGRLEYPDERRTTIMTREGRMVVGVAVERDAEGSVAGWVPHHVTCPDSDRYRKRGQNESQNESGRG